MPNIDFVSACAQLVIVPYVVVTVIRAAFVFNTPLGEYAETPLKGEKTKQYC
jgi:hypothetical protein